MNKDEPLETKLFDDKPLNTITISDMYSKMKLLIFKDQVIHISKNNIDIIKVSEISENECCIIFKGKSITGEFKKTMESKKTIHENRYIPIPPKNPGTKLQIIDQFYLPQKKINLNQFTINTWDDVKNSIKLYRQNTTKEESAKILKNLIEKYI